MNDWSDFEDNFVNIVILVPDKVDSMTGDKEINANGEDIGSVFSKDVTRPIEIHWNSVLTDIKSAKSTDSEPTDKETKKKKKNGTKKKL